MLYLNIAVLFAGHKSPDCKVHITIMGPTWVLLVPGGPHAGPINFAIREYYNKNYYFGS